MMHVKKPRAKINRVGEARTGPKIVDRGLDFVFRHQHPDGQIGNPWTKLSKPHAHDSK